MVLYLFLFDVKVRVSTNMMQETIRRIENEQTNKGLDSNIAGVIGLNSINAYYVSTRNKVWVECFATSVLGFQIGGP